MNTRRVPLVVDLDGTLIKSDVLLESFFAMVKRNPFLVVGVFFWLFRGKAFLKYQIAAHSHIDVKTLPYHQEFLEYLKQEHAQGRELILATASVEKFASSIAAHLGIFSRVFASGKDLNLSGKRKLRLLLEHFGEKGFDYAGNDRPDLHIFGHARKAFLVNPIGSTLKQASKISPIEKVFTSQKNNLFKVYFKTMRVYQWVKNALLFVPLVTSHNWDDSSVLLQILLGFISFGMCASGGYVFNDLTDLAEDRRHPRKKNRPIACGDLSIIKAVYLMLVLQLGGLALAAYIHIDFFLILLVYCLMNLAYAFILKSYVLIDVLVLAGLYTLRIVAGSILAQAPLSFWLFAFSVFIFFSLALVKRCSELKVLSKSNREYAGGRDYSVSDMDYLREMGIASGYLAILIFALYINSSDVAVLYKQPKLLWLACPVLFYWVSRLWLKTGRGEMTDDPIVFSLKDRGSLFVLVVIALIVCAAI